MVTRRILLRNADELMSLLGQQDENLRRVEHEHGVQIFVRQGGRAGDFSVAVRGQASHVERALGALDTLRSRANAAPRAARTGAAAPLLEPGSESVYVSFQGKPVVARTPRQRGFIEAVSAHDLVFAIGPAGTGKTYLAVACALRALQRGRVSRIVITRPVVEAGERLGFLPGDLYEKINPYLKPIYDAFYHLIGPERLRYMREEETVEIVPLAYMRGRTIDSAFLLLDEAQNTTPEQMKMFLTRVGAESQVVVTGDVTQIDLDTHKRSGLVVARKILAGVEGIEFVSFTNDDIVRHPLVRRVLRAYETHEKRGGAKAAAAQEARS